ncbi:MULTISPECIES: SCO family protein [Shimia]|uniref:SCO family protein n=1 Tax=Shimia TaxID=573139 RepID=UPI001FB37C7F|nr:MULTISPECIES: SCO family protein [Shimia]MDV4144680.1 SCO family protein [Shimia sp. FJ5]
MSRSISIVALVLVIGALGASWYVTRTPESDDQFAQCRMGAVAGGSSVIGGPFELVSETGETVTDKDVITEPSLLYFGYTFCPDVCPLDTARNAEAITLLEERGQMVQPVFISVDSDRDTPETMAEFTDIMHPRMLGLTGSAEQVKAASQAYRTYYKKQDDGDPEYFLIDHSTFSYLVLPEHGFVEYFKRDLTPEQMADRIGCFISKM